MKGPNGEVGSGNVGDGKVDGSKGCRISAICLR